MTQLKTVNLFVISAIGLMAGVTGILSFFGFDYSDVYNPEPMFIQLVGVSDSKIEQISRLYKIDKTNSDHQFFKTTTNSYKEVFEPSNGYTFDSFKINRTSATRENITTKQIESDGEKLVIEYTLKSGPKGDAYRGWLKAGIETVQSRIIPFSHTAIGNPLNASIKNKSELLNIEVNVHDYFEVRWDKESKQNIKINEYSEIGSANRYVMLKKLPTGDFQLVSRGQEKIWPWILVACIFLLVFFSVLFTQRKD